MIQLLFLLILTVILVKIDCTPNIGYIYNATYSSTNITTIITYNNTCSECICYGFFSSVPSSYVGLNCYENNKTCALFAVYSSLSSVRINLHSTFIFLQQTPSQNTTTVLPLLNGVTVAGYGNGTAGTASNALNMPWGLALGANGSLFVGEYNNHRVMKIQEGNLTGSIVAGTGISGNTTTQLLNPTEIVVDAASNLYINDDYNYRVMLWRKNSSTGVRVVGTGVRSNASNAISTAAGLAVDSQGNIYIVDHGNNRVMKWAVNATYGTLIAGITDVAGNGSTTFNQPYGIYLDENNSFIYITDLMNNRIQRFQLGVSVNGITVAGGNGQGSGGNQFTGPTSVCVSKKTGDIYVADKFNHRIQRWRPGATSGVTIVGVTGVNGTNATLLQAPSYVLLSMNETFLYVSDTGNNRVQRYELP